MFSFSWVIGFGEGAQGGSTDDVQLKNVMETIDLILRDSGSLTVDLVGGDEVGPESLHVEAEGGKSVISLGENTGEDYVVRTYTNESACGGEVFILGNKWDPKLVCEDSNVVKAIVKEFLSTGNVSSSLLN